MRMPALVLAALLAASSVAMAGDQSATLKFPATNAKIEQTAERAPALDRRVTGSVKRITVAEPQLDRTSKHNLMKSNRNLGIDVSPWIVPSFH